MRLKNVGYILLKSFWVLMSLTPLPVMYFISDVLFYPFYYLIGYRRKVTRKNLIDSFPEKSLEEVKRIEKKFYRFFLDLFFETCKYATISKKNMKRRMVFENMDEINRLLSEGKSISTYLGHYCNWEWISSLPLYLNAENAVAAQIYRTLDSKLVDKLMLENRSRMGAVSVEMDNTLRWLKEQIDNNVPTITGYIADQSPRRSQVKRHFLNFLNHYAPVLIGAEKITKRYNLEAYYLEVVRVKRGYYRAKFVQLDSKPSLLPDIKLTEIYYHHLEKTICEHPEFYLWTHRRFKFAKNVEADN